MNLGEFLPIFTKLTGIEKIKQSIEINRQIRAIVCRKRKLAESDYREILPVSISALIGVFKNCSTMSNTDTSGEVTY